MRFFLLNNKIGKTEEVNVDGYKKDLRRKGILSDSAGYYDPESKTGGYISNNYLYYRDVKRSGRYDRR